MTSNSNSCFLLLLCLSAFFSYSLQDACTNVTCGEGTCVPDLLGLLFHCDCNPGWKTIQVGPMSFGACIIPNCTLDFSCGGTQPPTPPFPPPINFTSPCNLVWCGDGDCVVNSTGTGHYCQCHDRAANLFNNPEFVCMKQCYLDGDCNRLGLGPPPSPPSSVASPGPGGKNEAAYSLAKLPTILVAIFTTLFLSRI
ncbi:unnamed protein product [Lactuca virosa]|uniref:EGF-like domain-containing protein n=1 Tax=Lactuca virosa TaxID=75947 RepID=A0AAU9NXQ9_9ASTR|nr:unnamed protein product [Lactuca virosa]